MMEVTARAHAKVNLALGVGPRRADGYHELCTVFQSLDMHDLVRVRVSDSAGGVRSLDVTGLSAQSVPCDARNVAWQAADRVLAATGAPVGVHIDIAKSIPTAGGMAGGSADAAAALVATNHLVARLGYAPLSTAELVDIAAEIGSDVPFTLLGGTRLGTGRGEQLTPLPTQGMLRWVIAAYPGELSTPLVFSTLDSLREKNAAPPPRMDTIALQEALARGADSHELGALIFNDMAVAAVHVIPELADILAAGVAAGAAAGMVSGSGPTCAFLCADDTAAENVAAALRELPPVAGAWLTYGPASGAVVIDSATP